MSSHWALAGAGLLLSSGVLAALIAISFPELPLSSCTDVGYVGDEPPGGFVYYEFYLGWLGYSPDGGVNRCDTPIVTIALGLLALGSAMLGLERWKR
ncbi:hypothetical protein [Natronorubrum sulfidifaciens]|uniref:Uncharacterized protein n=1 Tax=Natronorubrum sulfidifaciens JCM 14089 TaxID=1230460 RepID=L9W2Z4_9EURY|nr:hypothetical protein [Natronorubrum sulfidifaciens]ELY43712.1 hypothetical protein C495_12909 [Natronorubrum sulfidifaciens JCM 14089]